MKRFIILAATGSEMELPAIRRRAGRLEELVRIYLSGAFERISYHLADKLVVYSPSMIEQAKLRKYIGKITVAHRHFLNLEEYAFKNDIEQRENVVGFVGRLTADKGIPALLDAIPNVLNVLDDVKFIIIGEGVLDREIQSYIDKNGLGSRVKFTGWIPHNELPDHLASMKLLVLPSYREGLPNIMLEVMACGTPFLGTPVGSVPDIVKDKENGFLIRDNSPSCLAETIVETLQYPHLKNVVVNARSLIESEFRYEKLIQTWRNILYNAR